ncbi:C39 family peptidase [Atopobiaceae bacterium 24-176]
MDMRPSTAPANPYLEEDASFPAPSPWQNPPRLRVGARVLTVLAAVMALCLIAAAFALAGATAHAAEGASASDPVAQWRQGSVPRLYQTDPTWAKEPYAGATMETSGCGPTCLSAVYACVTGRTDLSPTDAARLAERGGHVEGGLTAWTLMDEGAASVGLASRPVAADAGAVRAELAAGRPVIASMGPGDFTSSGHFIVLTAVDDAGRLRVMDPNSEPRTEQPWNLERTLSQARALWSFSRG